MNIRTIARSLAMTAAAIALAGCFEVNESIEVREDGSAKLVFDMAMSLQFAAMAPTDADRKGRFGDCNEDNAEDWHRKPGVKEIKVEQVQRGDMLACIFTAELDHISRLNELGAPKVDAEENLNRAWFRLEPLEAGRYRFRQDFNANKNDRRHAEEDPESARMAEGLIAATMAGRYFTISVSAAKIENTNGELSADGKSVVWRLPITALITGQEGVPMEFYADLTVTQSWWERLKAWVGLT